MDYPPYGLTKKKNMATLLNAILLLFQVLPSISFIQAKPIENKNAGYFINTIKVPKVDQANYSAGIGNKNMAPLSAQTKWVYNHKGCSGNLKIKWYRQRTSQSAK